MTLPVWHVQNKKAAIIHEVTHILTNNNTIPFYAEGIAVCFQERFGEDDGFPTMNGEDIDSVLNANCEHLFGLQELIDNRRVFSAIGTGPRIAAYMQSGSFFDFLLSTYGKESLSRLESKGGITFEDVYGNSLNTLEEKWKAKICQK